MRVPTLPGSMLICRRTRSRISPSACARTLVAVSLALAGLLASAPPALAQGQPITFSVIGDIPYDGKEDLFLEYVDDHNRKSSSRLFFHVGDIKSQSDACPEFHYEQTFDILTRLAVPSFIVPGDNEWNDCADPDAAWALWETWFTDFEQNFCGPPAVEAQAVRHENFAFVRNGVLFVGLNLVGGSSPDRDERDERLQDDADWVEVQFTSKASQVRAAVLLAHAERSGSRDLFFDQFDASAAAFGKPVLFIHGDTHDWAYNTGWGAPNVSRISIERNDPPLEVTVSLLASPFSFERDPWPAGTPDWNAPPCVEAGPDQSVDFGDAVALDALATDDHDPAFPSLSFAWSTPSGPGGARATFSNPNALATSATFPAPGNYVLRLTASDGQLATSDDVAVQVKNVGPLLRIGGASVVEGDSGTVSALFTVELLAGTGATVTVDYATANGTAQAGSDYQARSGSLTFSGSTTTQTISVPVIGELVYEAVETFTVNLSGASGATIDVGSGTGVIVDNDPPPLPTIASFTPTRGPSGTVVTVNGQHFTGATAVTVGGASATFTLVSDTQLRFSVPGNAHTGPIRITNGAGAGASTGSYTMEFFLSVTTVGSGSVGLAPGGGRYAEGTSITLTPAPGTGWEFLYWRGDYGGLAEPGTLVMTRNKSVIATFVPAGSVVRVPASGALAGGSDDAEERPSGSVSLGSGDLELAVDGTSAQTVGLRFPGLDVPQGATVLSATIQFTADEVKTGAASLVIRGESANSAAPFASLSENVSGRSTTGASVPWNPPGWTAKGDAGAAQRTPDLAAIVQEIVARPGWVPGNAIAFLITGTGTRTAEAYEGGASVAPRLSVIYQGEPDEEAPTVPANLRSPARSETTIDLAWDAATDNVGVTGYRVVGPAGAVLVSGTSYTATGLGVGTSYDFQVSALDEAGNESAPSPPLTVATLPPDTQAPTSPQNLRSPLQTGSTIELAWDAASDDRELAGYRVYGPNGSTDVSGTSHVAADLVPRTQYAFQVSALDAAGNESDPTPVLLVSTGAADPVALSLRIAGGSNDAEQALASGSLSLGSSDLELGFEGSAAKAVGLRFTGVAIPPRARILSASLLFTVDEQRTGASSLEIRGVASDDAAPFAGSFAVSGRPTTAASVAWSPPDWTLVGQAGLAQRTPDLSALVEEIVARPGWASGHALAFAVTGSGTRTAEAVEGSAAAAPLLEVVYLDEPDLEAPSTPENLRSTARTSASIDLAWDAADDDRGVAGYRVYGPGGAVDVPGTSFVATGLDPSTPYAFRVSAFDAAGNESDPSPELQVSTADPDLTDPSPPQNLRSPAQTGTTIELAWDAASDDVGVTGYRVYGPGGATLVPGTSHLETGLAPATAYGFQVSALDAAGNESDLSAALVVSTGPSEPVEFRVRIAADGDDVEQRLSDSSLDATSSDIELIQDGSRVQLVGLRFLGIPVPAGARIVSAYVQFAVDEATSGAASLLLRAELAANAAPFGTGSGLPSARATTAASASWAPADWPTVGAAGPDQRTPDLAPLVQEVVDQPGWSPGNALVLLVSGSGRRTAEAFDGVAAAAPELVLVYEP
jgi:chitodextrinase